MVVRTNNVTGTGDYFTRQLGGEARYVRYLSKEEQGVVLGDGAAPLGLATGSRIDPRALRNLLEGNYPDGRPGVQKQKKEGKAHQAGTELVFSTSKHFDCLYGAATPEQKMKLRALFRRSVERQLRRIEKRYAKSRKGRGGKEVVPCRLVFACFYHDTNRENEPHLHCHVVIPNLGVRPDGKVRTILSKPFYRAQRCLGSLFDHDLSHALAEELGLRVRPNGRSYLIDGVPTTLAERWSTRSRQIRELLRKAQDKSFRAKQEAARATRKQKTRPDPSLHNEWLRTAGEHGFDSERLVDPARIGRPPLSDRTQTLFADAAVFDAAEELASRLGVFKVDDLTDSAAVRCLGSRVAPDHLLAAVERAVTRPLEHGLAPDGERDGEPLFKRWDPPDPPVAARLPNEDALNPGATARVPGDAGGAPYHTPAVAVAPTGVAHQPDEPAPPFDPGQGTGNPGLDLAPAPDPVTHEGGQSPPAPERDPGRRADRAGFPSQEAGPTSRDAGRLGRKPPEHALAPKAAPGRDGRDPAAQARPPRLLRDRFALWLAPVRAWVLVRQGTKELASLRGHFTRTELIDFLTNGRGATGIPPGSVALEVDRALKNLNRHKLVPVGRRGKEVVFTTRAQKRLELAVIRLADALSARLGRGVKGRYRRLAAALVRDGGAEEAAQFLTDRPRLRLLDAKPGQEQAALLNHAARAFERSGGRVHWLAPTALGAEGLRRRTGNDATTVGSFLRRVSPLPAKEVLRHLLRRPFRPVGWIAADVEWLRKPLDHLRRRDVVVVDLAHLLGTKDLHDLLKAVGRSRAKLILAGDTEGISPAVAGGGWQYLTTRLPVTRIEARETPTRSPEAEAADLIRRGRPKAAVEALDREGRLTFAADPADAADRLLAAYKLGGGLQNPAWHLVVVGSKTDAARLNRRVQRERRRAGLLGVASARVGSGASVRIGDRVAFTRPSRKLGVRSGERGGVTFVNPLSATVWVRTDGGRSVAVPLRRFPHLDLAYAATAARSSGIDADRRYALVRGPAFVRGAVLSLLERTRERVEVFTPLGRDALAATVARLGEKRLAVAHGREGWWPRTPPGLRQGPSPAALGLTGMPAMDPM